MKLKLIAALLSACAFTGTAFAAGDDICLDVTDKKPIDEAKAVAVAVGFADVTEMKEEHGCYEAKGLNANGSKFEVYIHPTTLQIAKVKIED